MRRRLFGNQFVARITDISLSLASVTALIATVAFSAKASATETGKATANAPKEITIGFNPGDNSAALKEGTESFAKLLQARIGIPVHVQIAESYSSLIDAMKEKKIDFAFFSAMSFVFAEKMAGAKVLLKHVRNEPYYYSVILSKPSYPTLQSLKGRKIAFVDSKSASGYLYPSVHFKKLGLDPKAFFGEVVYSGHHDSSVKLLNEGKVDAIAVFANDKLGKTSAWTQFGGKGKVKTLWVSAPIPNDPFCVRQDFYDANPRISHDLMFAMIELLEDAKDGARFKQALGVSSMALATSQQYEPVREMVRELDLKLQ
jgi:phosphonate transport system substrate-binding protein